MIRYLDKWLESSQFHQDLLLLVLYSFFTAPDQPVDNLLQLLTESGTPCQEDLPAWLFVFLHSCQDETGQLDILPPKCQLYQLKTKIHRVAMVVS